MNSFSLMLMLFRLFTASTLIVYLASPSKSVMLKTPASVLDWLYTVLFSKSFIITTYLSMLSQLASELYQNKKFITQDFFDIVQEYRLVMSDLHPPPVAHESSIQFTKPKLVLLTYSYYIEM